MGYRGTTLKKSNLLITLRSLSSTDETNAIRSCSFRTGFDDRRRAHVKTQLVKKIHINWSNALFIENAYGIMNMFEKMEEKIGYG